MSLLLHMCLPTLKLAYEVELFEQHLFSSSIINKLDYRTCKVMSGLVKFFCKKRSTYISPWGSEYYVSAHTNINTDGLCRKHLLSGNDFVGYSW